MPELDKSDLYNFGLAVFNTLDNDTLEPKDIMDFDTRERFDNLCDANKNFKEDLTLVVKDTKKEYQNAMRINEKDYSNPEDFFEAKKAAEEKVLEKLTDKMSAYI